MHVNSQIHKRAESQPRVQKGKEFEGNAAFSDGFYVMDAKKKMQNSEAGRAPRRVTKRVTTVV